MIQLTRLQAMRIEEAFDYLSFNEEAVEGAIKRARSLEPQMPQKAQELSKSLLQNREFLEWMLDMDSTKLFINGIIEDGQILNKEWAFTLATSTGEFVFDVVVADVHPITSESSGDTDVHSCFASPLVAARVDLCTLHIQCL